MNYLATMENDQTLVMYSGHPMGLFPSKPSNPRMIITNGMVIPNYSSKEEYDKLISFIDRLVLSSEPVLKKMENLFCS